MEIYWKSPKIKRLVEKYVASSNEAAKIMISIKAAANYKDLSRGNPHFLKGKDKGSFAIDLISRGNGKRLICKPYGVFIKDKNFNYDINSIVEIIINKVTDHYKN